jgi:ATP-binding cassette subfamily C protein
MQTYIKELLSFARLKAVAALLLLIFLGLTQGIGLLMLFPFLHLIGLADGRGSTAGYIDFVGHLFQDMGIPLTLPVILCAYIGIVSLHTVAKRWETVLNAEITQGFTRFLRDRLYTAVAQANWLFITRNKSSDITHVLTSELDRVGSGTYHFLMLISTGVIAAVHLGLAFMLSVPMTALALACAAILLLLLRSQNRKSHAAGKTMSTTVQGLYGMVMEHLGGMKLAKSCGAEHRHVQAFHTMSSRVEKGYLRFAQIRATTQMLYGIGAVVILSIFFYTALEAIRLPLASLLILVFLFARLLPMASLMQQSYQFIVNMLPAFAAATDLKKRCLKAQEKTPDVLEDPVRLERNLVFHNVSFRYNNEPDAFALSDVNISLPAQSMTGVVGPSGAGKTTLSDLLMGLLTPERGDILVDGRPLGGERLHAWRQAIGYVPQETFLFHDTIRANLLWARPEATEEELWSMLGLASADRFVTQMSAGLDTVIGDRGIRLSGGERQRIALARALLRKPTLLVLDEATSALDAESERTIQRAIEQLHGKMTIVVIAHRLSTMRWVDRIIVLEEGRVVEAGRWDDLVSQPEGRFQALLHSDRENPVSSQAV